MGLDVALGVIILIAAIRGWLQGFFYQFIRMGGLIACVYLAAPARDQVKPHVMGYLSSIRPDLVDRLLWWVSASVTYILLVGVLTLAAKMTRRPEIPGVPPQRSRNDQFAGFLFGIVKGGVIAAFLVAAVERYGSRQIEAIPWAEKQVKSSHALAWNGQYHPAARIWESIPVQHYVSQIQRMGLQGPPEAEVPGTGQDSGDRPVVQTARRGTEEGSKKAAGRRQGPSGPPAPPAQAPPPGTPNDKAEPANPDHRAAPDPVSRTK